LEGRTGRTDRTGRTFVAGRIYYRPYSLFNAGRTVFHLQRSELLIGLVFGLSRHHFRGLEKRERAKYTAGLFCTAVCNFEIEEIRRTPSLSLVFPTLGFFQGQLTKTSCVIYLLACWLFSEFVDSQVKDHLFHVFQSIFILNVNAH